MSAETIALVLIGSILHAATFAAGIERSEAGL